MPEFRFRRRKNKGPEEPQDKQPSRQAPSTGRSHGPPGDPPVAQQGAGLPSPEDVQQADNPLTSGGAHKGGGGQLPAESSVSTLRLLYAVIH